MTLSPALFSSEKTTWGTPIPLYNKLNKRFGPFNLDVAADSTNHKAPKWLGPGSSICEDAFAIDWGRRGVRAYMNCPYSRSTGRWVRMAWEQSAGADITVLLLPSRTDTKWYHKYVWNPFLHSVKNPEKKVCWIYPIKGRVQFEGAEWSAPFPSAIVVYYPRPEKDRE